MVADVDQRRIRVEFLSENSDIFEGDAVGAVRLVRAVEENTRVRDIARNVDVANDDVLNMPRFLRVHVLVDDGTSHKEPVVTVGDVDVELQLRNVDVLHLFELFGSEGVFDAHLEVDVLDKDVFHNHSLAGFEKEVARLRVDDVDIAEDYVAHVRGAAFMSHEDDTRAIAPEDAIFDGDVFAISVVYVEPFERHAVVVGSDEGIAHSDATRITGVDSVVVLHASAAELDILDENVVAVYGDDGPVRRAADNNPFDMNVLRTVDRKDVGARPSRPRPL